MQNSQIEVCQMCGEPLDLCNCEHKDWNEFKLEELKLEKINGGN